MQPTLSPKPNDDPCDDVVTVPEAVRIAPTDDELSLLLQQAARQRSATEASAAPELKADPTSRPTDMPLRAASGNDTRSLQPDTSAQPIVPMIDVMDRPAPANDDLGSRHRRSWGRRAVRAVVIVLLASGIGLGAAAWKSYGAAATKMIARLAAQLVVGSPQSEQSAVSAEPAPPTAPAETATAASAQPAPAAQTTPAPAAPAPEAATPAAVATSDQAQLLQSMTHDLATLQQQVQELKAGMDQLKADQQQMSRDLAKASETKASEAKPRPKTPATTPAAALTTPQHSAAVQTKRPMRPLPVQQGYPAAPAMSQAPAPYQAQAPYQAPAPYYGPPPQRYAPPPQAYPPPQATAEPPIEWDSSAPRPPMPLR